VAFGGVFTSPGDPFPNMKETGAQSCPTDQSPPLGIVGQGCSSLLADFCSFFPLPFVTLWNGATWYFNTICSLSLLSLFFQSFVLVLIYYV
jgi:hypothetical protein